VRSILFDAFAESARRRFETRLAHRRERRRGLAPSGFLHRRHNDARRDAHHRRSLAIRRWCFATGVGVTTMKARWVSVLVALVLAAPGVAFAKTGFGDRVDAFCSAQGRGTPFADRMGQGFLSECSLCHAFNYPPTLPDKGNTFDPPARDYLAAKQTGDYSAFCPAVTNQLPSITPIADRSANVGQMVVIDVSASDADGDALALSVSNAPAGSSFVDNGDGTASFTWTPGAGDVGSRTVTFLAQDDAVPPGQAMEPVAILVGSTNRPPVLGAIGNRTGDPGALLEIAVAATDPDGDALSLSAAPLPAGATFSDAGDGSALFSWTPAAGQVGNHAVTFRVMDDGVPVAQDSEAVTLTIGRVNARPTLDPIGNRRTRVGMPLHVALHASDPDGGMLAFDATGLPPGAVFTDAGDGTAAIDWTPASLAPSSHPVTVSVSDDGVPPEADAESFLLMVEAAAPPSEARIDDAWWEQKGRFAGRLRVLGSGARPKETVAVLDAETGLVIGSRPATGKGDFKLKIEPIVAPCEVQVQAGDARGAPVAVREAPASCGTEASLFVRAEWECAEPAEEGEEAEEAGLEVKGARAPVGAQVEVREAGSGAPLGATQADMRGRFHLEVPMAIAPAAVEAIVMAGEHTWSSGPVPVGVDCDDEDEEDDEDDDEHEKPAKEPKKRERSDDREDD
jgi:hypothetical protein